MHAIGIIPARYGSTRLPKKMLADVNGKTLIQLTYENALKAKNVSELIVATDNEIILKTVDAFGGKAMLTDVNHTSGTDRIAEVAKKIKADVYINIQGDEPLLNPDDIDRLIDSFAEKKVDVATLAHSINAKEALSSDAVKVVCDKDGYALYFSRAVIPYDRDKKGFNDYYKHIGIYGYRREVLLNFVSYPQSVLENVEKLEQLRALEMGYKIKVLFTENKTLSIDVKEDLEKLKAAIKK